MWHGNAQMVITVPVLVHHILIGGLQTFCSSSMQISLMRNCAWTSKALCWLPYSANTSWKNIFFRKKNVLLNWYFWCCQSGLTSLQMSWNVGDLLLCSPPQVVSSLPALTWHALKPATGIYGFGCDIPCLLFSLMKAFFLFLLEFSRWNSSVNRLMISECCVPFLAHAQLRVYVSHLRLRWVWSILCGRHYFISELSSTMFKSTLQWYCVN